MYLPSVNSFIWLVAAWICVIFFSSTSLAGRWAEQFYGVLSGTVFGHTAPAFAPYDVLHFLADKGFHVTLFCVLAILLWRALPIAPDTPWVILVVGAVVGSCSEFLQRFFPDRDPALRDVLINIGGTGLGLLLCLTFAKRHTHRRTPVRT